MALAAELYLRINKKKIIITIEQHLTSNMCIKSVQESYQ